jgi:hypothetical protein
MDLTLPTVADPAVNGADSSPQPQRAWRRRRPWLKALLQLMRRFHLYAGLLMLPWALLYGVTGFLFNHPWAFSDQTRVPFGPAEMQGTPLADLPSSATVAQQAVAAINAKGKGDYRLVQPEQARFEQGFVATVRAADGKQYTVVLESDNTSGFVMLRQERREKNAGTPAPFAGTVKLDPPLARPMEQSVPAILDKLGMEGAMVTEVRVPPVSFWMEGGDGKLWRVAYNASANQVSGKAADEPAAPTDLSTRQFLLRLHLARGFPSERNTRWVWAILVDIMAAVMVFWGGSGLLMWWQIKSTRWLGLAVLLLSLVAAGWVGLAMHDVLTGR